MVLEIFTNVTAKISLLDFAIAVIVVAITYAIAKAVSYVLERYIKKITSKTKTTLDDRIIIAIERPIEIGMVLGGVYIALVKVSFFSLYPVLINKIFTLGWIGLGALSFLRLVTAFLEWYSEGAQSKRGASIAEIKPVLSKLIKIFVALIVLIIVFDQVGIAISPLLASLGIAGLAVALALQDTLSNFFSGIYLTAERPFKVGDFVKLETGEDGFITEIGWRTTKIKALSDYIIVIPNSRLSQTITRNYSAPSKAINFLINFSVSYDSDLEKVERIGLEVAKKVLKTTPGGIPDFEPLPLVRASKFNDSGIDFICVMRVATYPDQYLLTHEFIKALHKRFKKEGIEIPYPKRDVYIRKGKK